MQTSISFATLASLQSERDCNLGLPRSLFRQIDRLDTDFTTLVTSAQDSFSTLLCGVEPPFDAFYVLVDEDDIPEDASVPLSADPFLVAFYKYRSCCHSIGCRPSLLFLTGLCPSVSIFSVTFCRSNGACRLPT